MAILKVVSIYDQAIEGFNSPVCLPAIGAAVRGFMDQLEKDESMRRHAGDYVLYEIGEFDSNSGRVECLPLPRVVLRGSEVNFDKE